MKGGKLLGRVPRLETSIGYSFLKYIYGLFITYFITTYTYL